MIVEIITAISSLLSTVLVGTLGTLLYFKEDKKAKQLENENKNIQNETAVNTEWQKLYYEARDQNQVLASKVDELRQEIDALFTSIENHRNEKAQLRIELANAKDKIADLREENAILKATKCIVSKCLNRQPPSDI